MAEPWPTAVTEVPAAPPSNWMILASMQCLAKNPRALAMKGAVCTTLGGATEMPTLILRNCPVQLGAAWANDCDPPQPATTMPERTARLRDKYGETRLDMAFRPPIR